MPYPRKQAVAIMLSSRRRGDAKNEAKAKQSLRKPAVQRVRGRK